MKKFCYASIFEILYQARGACYTRYDMFDRIGWALNLNDSDWKKNGEAPDQSFKSQISNGRDPIPKKVKSKIFENIYSVESLKSSIEESVLSPDMIQESKHTAISRTLIDVLESDSEISPETIFFSEKEQKYTKEWLINNGDKNLSLLLGIALLYSFKSIDNRVFLRSDPISLATTSLLSRRIQPLSTTKKFDNLIKTKKLLEIGDCLCQLARFKGRTPNKFIIDQIEEKTAKLEELLPDNFSIGKESYDTLYSSIVDFYKNNDIVSYCGIVIGIFLSEVDGSMDTTVDLKSLPHNILVKPEKLESLIDEINHLSIKNKQDQIANFLIDQYINQESLDATASIDAHKLQDILCFLDLNCKTLKSAQELLKILIKQNQAIANKNAQNVLTAFKNTLDNLKDTEYLSYMKYRIWPESVWNDLELFEEICMDNIDIITTNSKNRQEAIELAEKSISIGKILNTDRDMQIFSRVAYEFSIASDDEFELLKKQISFLQEEHEED